MGKIMCFRNTDVVFHQLCAERGGGLEAVKYLVSAGPSGSGFKLRLASLGRPFIHLHRRKYIQSSYKEVVVD